MANHPLFYFVILKDKELKIFDNNFNPMKKPLNGFFSFIYFDVDQLMVVGYLIDYGSHHSGLNRMIQTLRQFTNKYRHHLFAHAPKDFHLPYNQPAAGGGVLFYQGLVILWHLKSGSYSQQNQHCHDAHPPLLKTLIQRLGLPNDRFINLQRAEQFEKYELPRLFEANGQFQSHAQLALIIDDICQRLQLPPITSKIPHHQTEVTYP